MTIDVKFRGSPLTTCVPNARRITVDKCFERGKICGVMVVETVSGETERFVFDEIRSFQVLETEMMWVQDETELVCPYCGGRAKKPENNTYFSYCPYCGLSVGHMEEITGDTIGG